MSESDVIIMPEYAAGFQCDGKSCGSYCCRDWRVPVDETAVSRFNGLPPEARDDIFKNIEEADGKYSTKMADGNCGFLRTDGLCRIQRDYGENFLPSLCFTYPRIFLKFPDYFEMSLTLSCPVAMGLIMKSGAPVNFISVNYALPDCAMMFTPLESAASTSFRIIQRAAIAILQCRALPTAVRISALFLFGEALDNAKGDEARSEIAIRFLNDSLKIPRDFSDNLKIPIFESAVRRVKSFNFSPKSIWRKVSLMIEAFELPMSDEKAAILSDFYSSVYKTFRREFSYSWMTEHIAVNECFMRLYPCAFPGSFSFNFTHLSLIIAITETALLSAAAKTGGRLEEKAAMKILGHVMSRIDHGRDAMGKISMIARRDFSSPWDALKLFDVEA